MIERESWRNVGYRVRQLRKSSGLTLKQLATGSDLSPNAISLVERGEVAPSVMTLCKIAHALGVPASLFFEEFCETQIVVTRARDGQTDPLAERIFNDLAKGETSKEKRDKENLCGLGHTNYQAILCVCGKIECAVNEQSYRLEPGDQLTFHGDAPYRWKNSGTETGVAILVISPNPTPDKP